MVNLIKKELSLTMHPTVPIMLLLSAMVLIPNYPYSVIFFYVSLSVFFTCLSGRENNDIIYSLNLPISKKQIVKARITFVCLLQMCQLVVMIPFSALSQRLHTVGNQAGMDANISLFAIGFIIYGLFNLSFFLSYYKNVNKVGSAFVKATVLIFVCVSTEVASTYAVPFVKNCLDTKDPAFLGYKLIFLFGSLLLYILLTFAAYKKSVKNFEKQDLN